MKKYNLFSDVLLTEGYLRSCLLDSLNSKVYLISKDESHYIILNKNKGLELFLFSNENADVLIDNELLFEVSDTLIDNFPSIEPSWNFPFLLTNIVININSYSICNLHKLNDFEDVFHYTFVFTSVLDFYHLDLLFEFIEKSFVDSIEFYFYDIEFNNEIYKCLVEKIENCKKILILNNLNNYLNFSEFVINQRLDDKISNFSKTLLHYSESQHHHTYFNRKLYISSSGELKNAPECTESFGNIQDINSHEELKQIVSTPEFQKYWFVKKDETDVCKDCEFRHMCVDNRLPYERSPNEWYHKIECNYNPYIAKWEGEEGYRTLAECGVISNEEGFSIDHEKIAEINEELWGEDDDNV